MLTKHDQCLVSNPTDGLSRFLIGVSDLVKEECCMAILRDSITLDRLMVYDQSI